MAELGKGLNEVDLKHPLSHGSAWAPLREPLFRSLWIAAVICYVGRWILTVASGWLMTSLTLSPLMVSLVQAASTLPAFLILLPAGALADTIDRRRFLLATQTWMVITAALLGVLTILNLVTPWILILFTFLIGFGAVMNDPAWQAITPEVVSEKNFSAGVALNSAGYNLGRAVGPAIGGLIIALAGTGTAFLLNAASIFGVILFLYRWKRRPPKRAEPPQRFFHAMRTGFAYARQAPTVHSVLIRTALFSFAAPALLALLPLIARPYGSVGYGGLLAFFGLGALAGAALLPRLRRALSSNAAVTAGTVVFAASTAATGSLQNFWLLCLILFLGGVGWIAIVATLNVSAQIMCPAWLRARALSMYLLVLQGGMAAGSAFWGELAGLRSVAFSMLVAGIFLLAGLLAIGRYPLSGEGFELTPTVSS